MFLKIISTILKYIKPNFAFLVLFVLIVVSCADTSKGDKGAQGTGGQIGSLETATIPRGTKSIFLPKNIDSSITPKTSDKTALMTADDKLVSNMLYVTTTEGKTRELLFKDSNGKDIRITVNSVRNIGSKFLAVTAYMLREVTVTESEAGDQIVTPTDAFKETYLNVLIDIESGKIYDISSIVKDVSNDPSLYHVVNSAGNYLQLMHSGTHYTVDLTNMEYAQRNDPKYDNINASLLFNSGDILALRNRCPNIFDEDFGFYLYPKNLSKKTVLKLDNETDFLKYKFHDTYMQNQSAVRDADNKVLNQIVTSKHDIYLFNSISPCGSQNVNYFHDKNGNYYTADIQTHYDKPVAQSIIDDYNGTPTSQADFLSRNGYSCKFNDNGDIDSCYGKATYLTISKLYIENDKLKKTEVKKYEHNFTSNVIGGLPPHKKSSNEGNTSKTSPNDLYADNIVIYDNNTFFTFDMSSEDKIVAKNWKLGEAKSPLLIEDCSGSPTRNGSCIVNASVNGVAWVNEDRNIISYIDFEEGAKPRVIVEGSFAGDMTLLGDTIYYTEQLTVASFATFAINVKTGNKEKISSSQMNIGTLLEFKL